MINTLTLHEAKDSSAIENIITTQDDLFKENLFPDSAHNHAAKEVQNYVVALQTGFGFVQRHGLLTSNHIIEIQAELERNRAGFRRLPGTELKNLGTGEVVYTPPQSEHEIIELMSNLDRFINDGAYYDADPLVKMAIIHYQFESIHPFYDGNGRTGRIVNVLYLVLQGLLDIPVLYLSRHIIRTKNEYSRLLQKVRDDDGWGEWVLYMLTAVEKTRRAVTPSDCVAVGASIRAGASILPGVLIVVSGMAVCEEIAFPGSEFPLTCFPVGTSDDEISFSVSVIDFCGVTGVIGVTTFGNAGCRVTPDV
ncbi:MAG: Fic family protein [Candidatus Riflebacteria bacterium]|nr:Fic family protein [Candidatus Riflebacteria bacterium]